MTSDTWTAVGYNVVGPLLYGAIGYLIAGWRTLRRPKPHRMTAAVNSRDIRVHEMLAALRVELNAEHVMRCYVAQLHNGDEFVTGGAMRRKSRTHEVVRPGVAYQQESFQSLLLSSIPQEMELVMSEGPSFKLVDEIKEGKFRSLCEMGGIRSVARAAIFSGKELVAFVGVDFDHEEKPPNIEKVCDCARLIAPLLPEPRMRMVQVSAVLRRLFRRRGPAVWRSPLLPKPAINLPDLALAMSAALALALAWVCG